MGRGNKQERQASSGGLLFGPRRPTQLSPERKQQLAQRKRQRNNQARRNNHLRALRHAEEELLKGNSQPMLDFLAQPPVHGTIGAERQELRELSSRLRGHFRQAPPPSTPSDLSSITALQQLRQRAARELSRSHQASFCHALVTRVSQIMTADIGARFDRLSEEIGPLPRIWICDNKIGTHFRTPDGQYLLCGEPFKESARRWHHAGVAGEASPLSDKVTCEDCLAQHRSGYAVESHAADVWPTAWHQQQTSSPHHLEYQVARILGWNGPAPTLEAEAVYARALSGYLTQLSEALEDHCCPAPAGLRA